MAFGWSMFATDHGHEPLDDGYLSELLARSRYTTSARKQTGWINDAGLQFGPARAWRPRRQGQILARQAGAKWDT